MFLLLPSATKETWEITRASLGAEIVLQKRVFYSVDRAGKTNAYGNTYSWSV